MRTQHVCIHSRALPFFKCGLCITDCNMSKENLSFRVPSNLRDDIEAIQEREGIDHRSEAARQVLRRGIEHSREQTAGERLAQQATGIAGVGSVVAAIGALTGAGWAVSLVVPFAAATFLFAMFWASIRALAGRDLV